MAEFFQEHKRAIAAAAIAALLFLVAHSLISGHYGDVIGRARLDMRRAEDEEKRFKVTQSELEEVRQGREVASAKVLALTQRLQRVQDDGLKLLPTIADADLHYNRMADVVRRDELERCAIANIDVDMSLGLPDAFPTTRREIDWYLRGLDVVKQVLGMVLAVNAEVLEGGIARLDRIEIAPASKTRKDGAAVAAIGRIPVTFVLVGHPLAVGALRERLARPVAGRSLALLQGTERSLDMPPGSGPKSSRGMDPLDVGRTQVTLTLAALDIDAGAAATEK
ncbi:MAG: hypothetical protein EXS14_05500 [Planctomycetes bacterium]|nr:hypothetical protein [Planctomycetota bacterium]